VDEEEVPLVVLLPFFCTTREVIGKAECRRTDQRIDLAAVIA
jgi:hypothetical protein